MQINQDVNIHNRFDIEVRDSITGKLKQKAVAYNIVLDQMYTRLCAGNAYFANIHFGTGDGEISAARTSLFTHLGTRSAATDELIKAFPVSKWKRKIVLNPEEYVGSVITEVGISFGSTASNLVTHAMLKDSEGNSISIDKTSTDVVTIYATVFITFVNTLPTMRLLGLPNNNQLINYLTGSSAPSGSFGLLQGEGYGERLGSTSGVSWVSDVPNRQRKTNTPRFDIGVANGDVKSLEFTNLFALEFPTPGVFTGQPYANVPLGVGDGETTEFVLPSRNIIRNTLKIKKDGVITTEHTPSDKNLINFKIQNPSVLPSGQAYGVALTPDGNLMAVAHETSPFITTYDWNGADWVKRPNPSVLPASHSRGVALTPDGNLMAVAHETSPFITTYDWNGADWVKRPNPSVLPASHSRGVALTPDGNLMAVAHETSPFITTYDWNGADWVKRPNPSVLPASHSRGVALTPDGNLMAVVNQASPYIITYDWNGADWVKRPNPAALPASHSRGVALTPDGNLMAVAHDYSPYITTYDWDGADWVKRPNPSVLPSGHSRGVALTPDGNLMAVVNQASPYIITYDWNGADWVKRPNPSVLPSGQAYGVALTPDGNLMAVAHDYSPYITTYDCKPRTLVVTFDVPPSLGTVLTADYTTEGVHKTINYVIDASFVIQFGEGV